MKYNIYLKIDQTPLMTENARNEMNKNFQSLKPYKTKIAVFLNSICNLITNVSILFKILFKYYVKKKPF